MAPRNLGCRLFSSWARAAATIAATVAAAGAAAAPLVVKDLWETVSGESDVGMSYNLQHGAIFIPGLDIHHHFIGGASWPYTIDITERNGFNDRVHIDGLMQHVAGPHGEPPNPGLWNFKANVNADNLSTGDNFILLDASSIAHPPTNHPDEYAGLMKVFVVTGPLGSDQIKRYQVLLSAWHRQPRSTVIKYGILKPPAGAAIYVATPDGAGVMRVDDLGEVLDLDLSLQGAPPSKLVSADLREGTPGSNGPVILDLGGPSEWDPVGSTGALRHIEGASIDPAYLPSIEAGGTYFEILTNDPDYPVLYGVMRGPPRDLLPSGFNVVYGVPVSGSQYEIEQGDDRYLVVQSLPRTYVRGEAVNLEFASTADMDDPLVLEFSVQAAVVSSGASLTQSILLFDYSLGVYVVVDERAPGDGDSVASVRIESQPGRYVEDGSLSMTARVKWVSKSRSAGSHSVYVDQVKWRLTH